MRLRPKIILSSLFFMGATGLGIFALTISTLKAQLTQELHSKGQALTKNLAVNAQDILLSRDASTIQGLVDEYKKIENVAYIMVISRNTDNGDAIYHSFSPVVPDILVQEIKATQSDPVIQTRFKQIKIGQEKRLQIQTPILAGHLGFAEIGMDLDKIEHLINLEVFKSLLIALFLLLLGFGVLYLILRKPLALLSKLTNAAKTVSETGNLDFPFQVDSNDEIGSLAHSFRIMVDEIKKSTESQIEQGAKMAELGEISAGIGHEIQNPLAIVLGMTQKLKRKISESNLTAEEAQELTLLAEKIAKSSTRIQKIVEGLRNYSRNSAQDPFTPVQVSKIFDDSVELCSGKLKELSVTLTIGSYEDFCFDCRITQIEQVIVNLIKNAADAISQKPERWIKIDVKNLESEVEILVTDSGNGIPPEIAKKLMNAFFTTKSAGKGTGLGLSISKKIAIAHGGTLILDSTHAHTRFVLRLPKTQRSLPLSPH